MSQPGGSATIYGVLYQILGSIHWASSFRLTARRAGDELIEAQLILEPAGGGGDIRVQSSAKRLVEQWKARSDRGAWSLQKIIQDVIPDLYCAVEENKLDEYSEYRCVTEGHRSRWEEAQD